MALRFRKTLRLLGGLVRLNLSNRSTPSLTFKVGPASWNTRRRRARVDLPGPFAWEQDPPRRRTRRRTPAA